MFNPLNSLVCSCITPYSNLIRLALYFKKVSLSALSGSSSARCSVMTPPAVLKRRSGGTKRTEHYPAEISGTWYHFDRNRSRNRISGTSLKMHKTLPFLLENAKEFCVPYPTLVGRGVSSPHLTPVVTWPLDLLLFSFNSQSAVDVA